MDRLRALDAAVAGHLLAHAAHGGVHVAIPVPTTGWRLAFVAGVVFVAPVAGLALAHLDRVRGGAAVLVAAGLGALAFEFAFHLVLPTPDHVGQVTTGVVPFAGTAAAALVGDLLLLAVGAWILRRERAA